jgi:hypothetical protein
VREELEKNQGIIFDVMASWEKFIYQLMYLVEKLIRLDDKKEVKFL